MLNNLSYEINVEYINDGELVFLTGLKMQDNGLEVSFTKMGDISITEEKIKGRVLSGRYDKQEMHCGYKFNYERTDKDYLQILNPDISLDKTVTLINDTKMSANFLLAKMVLSSIMRKDYRVLVLTKGKLKVEKIISAENEKKEKCHYCEIQNLVKSNKKSLFVEEQKEQIYEINGECYYKNSDDLKNSNIEQTLNELVQAFNNNPINYKVLIDIKNGTKTENQSFNF